ncbi:MAG: ATP-binding cassette domain-containing protein [Rhodospirillaceae bacterium]
MKLIELLRFNEPALWRRLTIYGGMSAVANVTAVVSLISGSQALVDNRDPTMEFSFFCVSVILAFHCSRKFIATFVNAAFDRMAELRCETLKQMAIGSYAEIQGLIEQNLTSIGITELDIVGALLPNIARAVEMALMAVVAYAYFWYISPPAAAVFFGSGLLITLWYLHQMTVNRTLIGKATERERYYVDLYNRIIYGNDEIKLGKANRDSVLQSGYDLVHDWDVIRRDHGIRYGDLFSSINTFTIMFSALVIFVFPRLDLIGADDLPTTLPFLLLMIRPMAIFLNTIPEFAAAEVAAITILEARQRQPPPEFLPAETGYAAPRFNSITLRNIAYTYSARDDNGQQQFHVGPFDLTIRPGSTIGMFGANGSGKSTLMRLIPLLLRPDSGEILLDGREISRDRLESYRDLFVAIYQDPYIPHKLPGSPDFDLRLFREMLEFFEIAHLVQVRVDSALRYRLSKGQKKRLSLAIALAEQRQILLLDEWTADQDARFRERFRNEIFAKFRELNKTIMFVSHDARVEDLCDTSIYLENGRISRILHRTGVNA